MTKQKLIYGFIEYKDSDSSDRIVSGTFEIISMDENFITFKSAHGNVISINKKLVNKLKYNGTYILEGGNTIYKENYDSDNNLKRLNRKTKIQEE